MMPFLRKVNDRETKIIRNVNNDVRFSYKWVLATLMLGVTLQWTCIPQGGDNNNNNNNNNLLIYSAPFSMEMIKGALHIQY